ncbi:alpha-xylosidase [Halobacillus shinanisalinarum]|uniref:Alpha-xylosidase n=1 Tax=Halobacillus shinanisalinarum TaxID=2932258 RepID=A0ABY4GVA3_9BACI|nr:alpha-xylosidase [Halobacillus shinanisalinarum]UOQ91830.1 alpha-xylosidase [Halobacillus shinanisalinarum]
MKFTNGFWLNREGYDIHHPKSVRDVKVSDNDVTLYAPCKEIEHRGDTLNIPLITIRLSSPEKDTIRVQAYHHKGTSGRKPDFQVEDLSPDVEILNNDKEVVMKSGQLRVKILKEQFEMRFYDGDKELTHSNQKGLAWIKGPQNESYMRSQLNLGVGENLYGLGERFTPFIKNGQVVDTWNKDGGTSSEQSYKNVPFYMSNKGYGVFVNHPENVSFEIGSEAVSKSQFSVRGEELDYYIVNGSSPKQVLSNYTNLTGKPELPPAWSFGLWLTTSFTTDYDEETVTHFVDGMAERDIPLSVFHFDCFWMKEFEWSNFEWDRDSFPDPEGMLRRLKEKGLKICVWINPYISQKSKLFDEAVKHGYLIKRSNGDVWQWDMWQAGMGIVDFTNPDACSWFSGKLKSLLDMGVDSFKTDFGERIPTDVVYFDESDPERMHNYYAYTYNQVVFNLLKEQRGTNEAVLFARSSTAGGQKFPVHWGGDCDATYDSMAESLRGGLSLTMSGFGYWSHDIGGFENTATADLFKRWTAFGLMSSHSRLHGRASYRVPWHYDEESVEVTRHFARLKNRLMPYLYNASIENHSSGVPVMRPMILEFPEDYSCHVLDRQYMLGDSILVAPIFNEQGLASYYLPKGRWTHLLSGKVVSGGKWKEEQYDYMSLPLYVREGSILALGSISDFPDYEYEKNIRFYAYEFMNGKKSKATVSNKNGEVAGSLSFQKTDNKIRVKSDMNGNDYSLVLYNIGSVSSVSSGNWRITEEGVEIEPNPSDNEFQIVL